MTKTEQSKRTVRELAGRIAETANSKENLWRKRLWRDSNDLEKPERAPVFCELYDTWPEILPKTSLSSTDPLTAEVEYKLRQILYKFELGDDDVVEPWFPLEIISNLGKSRGVLLWGVPVGELHTEDRGWIYTENPIKNVDDLEKISLPTLQFDERSTSERREQVEELLDGTLPVRDDLGSGWRQWAKLHSWASALCGMENLYVLMMDEPDFIHALMKKMMEGMLRLMDQCEAANILTLNNTHRLTSESIPAEDFDGTHVRFKDIWGRGESQELDVISPEMYNEFLFQYQLPILKRFGITNYGCCENLTKKIEYVKTIPNLRQFICSAWTDFEKAVDTFGDRCAIEWRQSPTKVIGVKDLEDARRHLEEGFRMSRGSHIQIMLDSVMTVDGNPNRLKEWVELAKEVSSHY
jgi:hypothetical protein